MWAYNVSFKNQIPPNKKPKIWHKRRLFLSCSELSKRLTNHVNCCPSLPPEVSPYC